jgi:hypothetical protein
VVGAEQSGPAAVRRGGARWARRPVGMTAGPRWACGQRPRWAQTTGLLGWARGRERNERKKTSGRLSPSSVPRSMAPS